MKRLVGAWAVCILAGALCVRTRATQAQTQETPPGLPKCLNDVTDYQYSGTFTQVQIRNQAAMRRQIEDQVEPSQITEKELADEIRRLPAETVIKNVKSRGVSFDMSPGIEKKLRKANPSEELIEAVRQAGPTFRAQMATMILGPGSVGVQNVPKSRRGNSRALWANRLLTRPSRWPKVSPSSFLEVPCSDMFTHCGPMLISKRVI